MEEENTDRISAELANKQIQAAIASPDIPNIYANGYICAQSLSDVLVVLQVNGRPNTVLNMSYTTAKSLAMELKQTIAGLESGTGHKIMTIGEVSTKTKKM